MEKRLVKIGEAAKMLSTTSETLRKWEQTGEVLPARKTKDGTRYYDGAELLILRLEKILRKPIKRLALTHQDRSRQHKPIMQTLTESGKMLDNETQKNVEFQD